MTRTSQHRGGSVRVVAVRFLAVLMLLLAPFLVSGQSGNVSVSATVEQVAPPQPSPTKAIFKGLAYPRSPVTVLKNGAVVVTVPADPSARFEIEISDLAPGIYTFSVFAEDSQGRIGRTSNFTLSVTQGTTTTVSGIFLGPTIATDKATVRRGDTITILGATTPVSEVTIFVESPISDQVKATSALSSSVTFAAVDKLQQVKNTQESTYKVNAGTDGLYALQLIADNLNLGDHTAKAKAVAPTNEISVFSSSVAFTVMDELEPDPCDGKRPGDLNCDGRVNLTDFSILLFYWKQKNPSHPRVDINKDTVVDIKDLSILLFWWTK